MQNQSVYQPKNKIRIVTAASLFDGHDAAINIMRRIMQHSGAEVIHLGHNRSVSEIVQCAIQEDVQAIAVSSYQGGHVEYFKYMKDLLEEKGHGQIKIFGGGGGVILPGEIDNLQEYGITRLYSPDDGRSMGLQGMVNDVLMHSDFILWNDDNLLNVSESGKEGRIISILENNSRGAGDLKVQLSKLSLSKKTPVIGITGTGGAGKSSLVDELVRRFITEDDTLKIGIVSVDPSKRKTGGALLGDRIRMNSIYHPNVYMRSMATRGSNLSLSSHVDDSVKVLQAAGYDLIILETSGIGQSDTQITDHCDLSIYVMTPEFGAPSQLEKIDMLDFADFVVINKSDKRGAADALRDVKKQIQRNQGRWTEPLDEMPAFLTHASLCFDSGVNTFYQHLTQRLTELFEFRLNNSRENDLPIADIVEIIPGKRVRYLGEIVEVVRDYNETAEQQAEIAGKLDAINQTREMYRDIQMSADSLNELYAIYKEQLLPENYKLISGWAEKCEKYRGDHFVFKVRHKEIKVETSYRSLSHVTIPKIALPRYKGWQDVLRWQLKENVPGEFPFAAGVFPFKREQEDPTRMFAGEGSPERTNKRFHYLAQGQSAKRLSTAFDSVTLYGENPDLRPDIYGKVGNSGVSVATLDDAKKLYSGFDLCDALTSVSMTINGPAPILTAFFLNVAIDQQCEKYIQKNGLVDKVEEYINKKYKEAGVERSCYSGELPGDNNGLGLQLLGISGDEVLPEEIYEKIKSDTLASVRGTVQADILKEDQAQNTCIFSVDFSLKMMGDVQAYFIQHQIRNFYSVSISGYHIAEAGANPITQLAFTLANGFTYVEYYLSRGMHIDDFAPNLSFFFSNGIDPEFSVIGRVARIIWSKTLKYKYGANERSQKLKYHIQTSGRSLHAQEIEFNEIRTTLQALYAIYDNCNSLHTNAYDEAITTPTEESVRRAMAIQLIINHELGLTKNQNPLQGAFIIEELTDLVEEAVLMEFERINERGGVLGAMETNYQRSKIQDESLYYEHLKIKGEIPIMGVNTFLSKAGSPIALPSEVIRSTEQEKSDQLRNLSSFHKVHHEKSEYALSLLRENALKGNNLFESLMQAVKSCSLGQITKALYDVGGQYRRNM